MQEGEEAAGEAGAVEVEEVFVLPVSLEIARVAGRVEFPPLSVAVAPPAVGDVRGDADVGVEERGEVVGRDGFETEHLGVFGRG